MFSSDQYELLDFGNGRRLERFGQIVLDRPCPTAEGMAAANAALWPQADARFERRDTDQGEWICRRPLPDRWTIRHGPMAMEMKRTIFGHVGVFAEQAENWDWIAGRVASGMRVLNLFAYTGGSTLAAAAAGAEVTHLDAAGNILAWARRNAELSGLAEASIRWIAEDAVKFAKRELRRGNHYDAVILDPPSYGHGPHGEVWRLSKHLGRLLQLCGELTAGRFQFMLLTCHTPGFPPGRLRDLVTETLGRPASAGPLHLAAGDRELPSGVVVRAWPS